MNRMSLLAIGVGIGFVLPWHAIAQQSAPDQGNTGIAAESPAPAAQQNAPSDVPKGFPKSTQFAPIKDGPLADSRKTDGATPKAPAADAASGANGQAPRFPPGGFTADAFPRPPLKAEIERSEEQRIRNLQARRSPIPGPSQPPVYMPNYTPNRPYGLPYGYGYGYRYGYGYPIYGWGNGWGYGVILPGGRAPAGGSNYFGNPHGSQYFGPPHGSQSLGR